MEDIILQEDKVLTNKKSKKKTLTQQLAPEFKAFGTTPEVVKENFLKVVSFNPDLKNAKPETLLLAIAQTIQAGVSLDPMDGEVALIPYKQGVGTVAQLQYMWKGLSRIMKRDFLGVKDLIAVPIKKNDIKTWDPFTGEATYKKDVFSNSFTIQQKRRQMPTIGYAGFVMLDEKIYNAKNCMSYMDLKQIAEHKEDYGSKTKINADTYSRKTLAKKAYRDFTLAYKDKIKYNPNGSRKAALSVLKYDASVNYGNNEIDYVENGKDE